MEVQRVQNSPRSITFNGYVGKSVYKYINSAVSNSMDNVIENANRQSKSVNINELVRIKELGDEITKKFEKYMADTHPNTSLEMPKDELFPHLRIKNPIVKNDIILWSHMFNGRAKERDLYKLNRAADELSEEYKEKYFDKMFLQYAEQNVREMAEKATHFFKKLRAEIYANFVIEFANAIDMPVGESITDFEKIMQQAAKRRKQQKNLEKSIKSTIKANNSAKKEILGT